MFAAAGVLVAGAALASPADARGYFGFSIVAPGYFAPPVVVDARAPNGYAAPYYAQPLYEDAYFDAPSYAVEGGPYYSAKPYYFGADFHNSRAESYHRANFRNETAATRPSVRTTMADAAIIANPALRLIGDVCGATVEPPW